YELAVQLARAGAAVVAHYNRDRAGAESAVEAIKKVGLPSGTGGSAIAVQADIARVEECGELVATCVREFGQIDIACCHAGITSWGKFLDYEEEAFDAVVNTNLKGTYFTAQAAARQMVKQGRGGRI